MHRSTTGFISIILLLLGSMLMLMLIKGFGFISSKYAIVAGVLCFIISVFIEILLNNQFNDIL